MKGELGWPRWGRVSRLVVAAVFVVAGIGSSATAPLVVAQVGSEPATVTLASSAPFAVFGQQVTLTATVTGTTGGPTPTGTVTFVVDGTSLSPETLASGQAAVGLVLPAGNHTVTANYSGDETYAANTQQLGATDGRQGLAGYLVGVVG